MRAALPVLIVTVLLARPAAALVAPAPTVDVLSPPLVYVSAIDVFPPPAGLTAPVVMNRTQNPDGSVDLAVDAGIFSVVHFGPGLAQTFSGQAMGHAFGHAGTGAIRVLVDAAAASLPLEYVAPFPGALGSNLYQSSASIGILAVFWDVIVPPPTAGKPIGSPTTLYLEPHFDCTVDGDYSGVDPGVRFGAGTGLYTDPDNGIGTVAIDDSAGCSPSGVGRAVGGVTVGTPVLVRFGVAASAAAIAGNRPFPGDVVAGSQFAVLDGLNTGYTIIKDADGNEIVGESGVHYGAKPVLPVLITTTTTTTTTTFVPPTTLPACDPNAYCGDGIHQPECGEACDCPLLPGDQVATVCVASASVPALDAACAVCAGCQVDASPCAVTTTLESTTTSTLTAASTTTTTTLAGRPTTTTTLPTTDPCARLTGFAGVQCVCGAGLAPTACVATDHVPAAAPQLFRKGCGAMTHAAGLTTPAKAKKAKALVRSATGAFSRSLAKVAKAAKKGRLSPACDAALSQTLTDAKSRSQSVASGL